MRSKTDMTQVGVQDYGTELDSGDNLTGGVECWRH